MATIKFKYVYEFYNFGELMLDDIIEEEFEVSAGDRFKLHQQEDGSFLVSSLSASQCVLTFPNKDNMVLTPGVAEELSYDEYYSEMGDDNHNVYIGTVTFEP